MRINGRALWILAAFVLVAVVASDTGATTFALGLVIAAIVAMELLTYVGVLGLSRRDGR